MKNIKKFRERIVSKIEAWLGMDKEGIGTILIMLTVFFLGHFFFWYIGVLK